MSLLAPLFLAGLLAIGLPWWLHRLSSDNPNKQRFSSLMFLEPGEPRRVLAKKVQYLLLLALRIGAHVDSLHKSALRAGADHRLVEITEPLDSVLRSYLLFRQRRG